jgi:hypothetical protein
MSNIIIDTAIAIVMSNKYPISELLFDIFKYNPTINIAIPNPNIVNDDNEQQNSYPPKDTCFIFKQPTFVFTYRNIFYLHI